MADLPSTSYAAAPLEEELQPDSAIVRVRRMLRGIGIRQIRLIAGLILFSYLVSHFLNHSLGNISLEAMEYGLGFHMALWRSWPGTLLLYPALAVHGSLGLWALYQRRQFKWKATELIQLVLGTLSGNVLAPNYGGFKEAMGRRSIMNGSFDLI
jgi:hypothetical protein